MRKILGFASIIILFIASCKNDTNSEYTNFENYTSDSLGISISYPKNYEAKEYFNQYVPLSFFEKIKDTLKDAYPENILFYIEPVPTQVEVPFNDFVQAAKTKLKIEIPEIEISDEDSISLDGIPTGAYTFHRPKVGGADFKSRMYIILQKDRAISISCTATEENFDTYLPTFNKIVNSIKLSKRN